MSEQKEDGKLKDGRMVLCAANKYKMKYFFNKNFDKIPQSMKEELHVISVLFAQEVGGIFRRQRDSGRNETGQRLSS